MCSIFHHCIVYNPKCINTKGWLVYQSFITIIQKTISLILTCILNILSKPKSAAGYNEDIALRRNCIDELNTKAATMSIVGG